MCDIWTWHMDLVHPVHPVINPLKLGCFFSSGFFFGGFILGPMQIMVGWLVLQVPS